MRIFCFIVILLHSLFCFNSKAQTNNSDVGRSKKAISSIIPPQLSYPANEEVINIKNPIFMWIPPHPVNGMMVTYAIRMVEIQKGQTPAEALLQNPPLLNLNGLTSTFISYPVSASPLHDDSKYAWQVAASIGGQNLGVTDINTFTVNKKEDKKAEVINYPVASKISKERFYVSHGIFYFAYNNKDNEKNLTYKINCVDKSRESIKGLPEVKLRPGMNNLQVDIKQCSKLKNGSYYYLEIKDTKQQVYKLMYYYLET
ncbi:MAG TPA: hypothetical protein VK809_02860 [Bacteroidia bacterium]|jgi:hypothetical protein|nr:hypothetical protein [Bacteroidia bacterium]